MILKFKTQKCSPEKNDLQQEKPNSIGMDRNKKNLDNNLKEKKQRILKIPEIILEEMKPGSDKIYEATDEILKENIKKGNLVQ